jgi:hypothetical protein
VCHAPRGETRLAVRSAAPRKPPPTLTRRDFFSEVAETARRALPPDERELATRQTMNLLKLHYGANYRVHYEVSIVIEKQYVELGLHFEDGPPSTARLLRHFDACILELKHELGPQAELERWTQSWGHLFELWPLEPLTPAFAARLAERLARYVAVLQPLLDEAYDAALVPREPHPSTFHERFRRGRS